MITCRDDVESILNSIEEIKIIPAYFEHEKEFDDYSLPKVFITKNHKKEEYKDFIVLDTETTGFNPSTDKIVQIAAILFKDFKPIKIFTSLVNPRRHIPRGASNVHHIYDQDVEYSPYFEEIKDQFQEFIKGHILIGHNLSFDIGFLKYEGIKFTNLDCKCLDTLYLARAMVKDAINHKLNTLCQYFRLDYFNYHDATEDVLATSQLFLNLLTLIFD